ncbi:hypothetical protein GCM10011410_17840 [Hoyosella rhizosphaerae]|uniref:Uncharacterized protein n=1 Tax=Hoyosella rhizosphaerae TaxID=1755582 RepID=A0A916XDE8_9ACTN|nr:hypothetical protein GCM10011410_17840 [Hoyosella rhizosphaerae]
MLIDKIEFHFHAEQRNGAIYFESTIAEHPLKRLRTLAHLPAKLTPVLVREADRGDLSTHVAPPMASCDGTCDVDDSRGRVCATTNLSRK